MLKKSGYDSVGGAESERRNVPTNQRSTHVSGRASTSTGSSGSSDSSVDRRMHIEEGANAIEEDDYPGARVDMFDGDEGGIAQYCEKPSACNHSSTHGIRQGPRRHPCRK